jgi:chorismate mutase
MFMRYLFSLKLIMVILLCGINTISYAYTATLADSKKVFQLINARFNYMQTIAAYKYINHVPVTVPIHQRVMMKEAVTTGLALHLNGQTVRQFYDVQIAIGKEIQRSWMHQWDQEPSFAKSIKLNANHQDWHMHLHTLDVQLLQQIAKAMPVLQNPKLVVKLRQQAILEINNPKVTMPFKIMVFEALLQIKRQGE